MRTDRQRELLQAAMQIVAEQGISKLTIRNIAAGIGVTEPAVYRHFGSKLELMSALMEDVQAVVLPHFRRLAEGDGSLPERLARFIRILFDDLTAQPAYAVFLFSEEAFHAEPGLRPLMRRIMQENIAVLTESVARLQHGGVIRSDLEAGAITRIMLGSVRISVSGWHISREPEVAEELCRGFAESFAVLLAVGQ